MQPEKLDIANFARYSLNRKKMKGNKTLTMIKPNAVEKGFTGAILAKINEAGFRIEALKMMKLSREQAEKFYEVHKERPFYEGLVNFMSSGPIVAAILRKENAVDDYRKLIGATNPDEAERGTVRNLFGTNVQSNAVHGSDSDENAAIESSFFFSKLERF
jgi:nucleoside-diphosphate kinase